MESSQIPIDDSVDLSSYLVTNSDNKSTESVGKIKKPKKSRKTPYDKKTDQEYLELKSKAKSLCSCYEQYRSVSRYSKEKLRDFVENKEFDADKAMQDNVFSFLLKGYGFILDKATKSNGHVAETIEQDISLRTAFEDELRGWIKYLSNKSKIATLTASDVYTGKMIEMKNRPQIEIQDITNEEEGFVNYIPQTETSHDQPTLDAPTEPTEEPETEVLPMQIGDEAVLITGDLEGDN